MRGLGHLLATLAASSLALAASVQWRPIGPADKDSTVTLGFALRAASPGALDDALAAIADIHTPMYGRYIADVSALVRPSDVAVAFIESFLHAHNISRSKHGDYVRVAMPVAAAEALFHTELFEYAHEGHSDRRIVRPSGPYQLPSDVKPHVLLVDGLDAFPTLFQAQAHATATVAGEASSTSVEAIQRAYDLPSGLDASDPRNAIVIGAFLKETFNQRDIESFEARNKQAPSSAFHGPQPVHCIGDGLGVGTGEASLDTQLVTALTQSQHATVLCYNANRVPSQAFDDSNQEVGAIQSVLVYADDECALPPAYVAAVDAEFKKAGVRGTTVVVSSGDNGVVGSTLLGFCGTPACSRYQEALVEAAVARLPPDATAKFNSFGRAYPDVVAVGHNVGVFVNGGIQQTDGTSVSAPVVASLLAHVNKFRLDHGNPPLGYVVPYLYKVG
ncbi:hypothetical protein DYB28_003881 [Aphanomyces astaci]|uniref:subtilisin n=1 Tax=Aphanomyces astaci TaxID=112090 RepID=A0A9X8DYZ6_APHAT|nr:hypothetical protein DYB28_003881 [Aphanomyces astaci]